MKIKRLWDNLKYWQRGSILGVILGFVLFILFYAYQINLAKSIGDFRYLNDWTGLILPTALVLILTPIFCGFLLGFLLNSIKQLQNFYVKWLLGISSFLAILLLFGFILYISMISIAKPY